MKSHCPNCKTDFYYDDTMNVKYFEPIASHIGFRAGGLFPICPTCETECKREQTITWENSQITVRKVWLPIEPNRLKD